MRSTAVVFVVAACSSSPSPPPPPAPAQPAAETDDDKSRRVGKEVILGLQTHIIVLKSQATLAEYRDVVKTVEANPQVLAAEGFVFTEVKATGPRGTLPDMAVKGVDPTRVTKIETLAKYITEGSIGSLSDAEPRIIVGDQLATTLGVRLGDTIEVELESIGDKFEPTQVHGALRVAGTFHTGFDEYDRRLSYVNITQVQALWHRGDVATGVEATVKDTLHADKTAKEIETALGGLPYQVMDWFELNRAFFRTRE